MKTFNGWTILSDKLKIDFTLAPRVRIDVNLRVDLPLKSAVIMNTDRKIKAIKEPKG